MADRKGFYCIDCSKFTEDEVVTFDSNEYPVVHHNDGHIHHVMFETDIESLLDHSNSLLDRSALYEIAEMYGISDQKLNQILAKVGSLNSLKMNGQKYRKFYCYECFANVEAECICDRIVGYDAKTDVPIVDMNNKDWYYLYGSQNGGTD